MALVRVKEFFHVFRIIEKFGKCIINKMDRGWDVLTSELTAHLQFIEKNAIHAKNSAN